MPLMSCSPSPADRTPNGHRGRKQHKKTVLIIPQQVAIEPIVWPAELTRQRHGIERQKISSGPASIFDLTYLFLLPLDIRHHIYRLMLREAGNRQHIFCPSVARRGIPRELHLRYLLSRPCGESTNGSCGHYDCLKNDRQEERQSNSHYLANFLPLMRTCKFAYREVAHFLYSEINFTFASFGELKTFLDWINPETALSIRSVTFIAHMLPEGTEHCQELIKGHYFRGTGWDHVSLFRRMPNLASLDIRFFPSIMLSFTTKFAEIMEPLRELAKDTAITVALPRMYYKKDMTGRGLPFVRNLAPGRAPFYALTRAVVDVEQGTAGCEAYPKFV
ncbi:uncharacterized protein B0H64DRAFT_378337 [Chaetomium fimeti]|uniref:DUF7730 domain-containing protein n=1 Tax=Chaetomium fimeti TaxID=1854472 RepID=A0AAE0LMN2_9PEZI|nr:hypothetical protein B0H64DRAFT_378337 [Chaetomium fimeti]